MSITTTRDATRGSATSTIAPVAPIGSDPLADRTRAVWTSGDFDRIALSYRAGAETFVEALGIEPSQSVLDLACGSGNLALPAARLGARVRGLDIAPNLLETARRRAEAEALAIDFDEGNAEALPYEDASFDHVISMFGIMFAPRHEKAAAELLRVTRRGGRIALASWTPQSFIGEMLRAHVKRVPPPAGASSPLLWGDEKSVVEKLAGVAELETTRRKIRFEFPFGPEGAAQEFHDYYGPTVRVFAALDPAAQEEFRSELVEMWSRNNLATDGTTRLESEYLQVLAVR